MPLFQDCKSLYSFPQKKQIRRNWEMSRNRNLLYHNFLPIADVQALTRFVSKAAAL